MPIERPPRLGLITFVLAFGGFMSVTTETLPSGLLTSIAPDLGVAIGPAGLLTTAYALAIVVTVLPLSRATLGASRKVLFTALLFAFAVSNIVIAFSPDFTVALLGRILGGAAHGMFWVLEAPLVVRTYPREKVARVLAIVFAGNSIGAGVGTPIGTIIGDTVGWRTGFLFVAIISTVLALAAAWAIPAVRVPTEHQVPLLEMAREPGVVRTIAGHSTVFVAYFVMSTFVAPLLEARGTSSEWVSAALAVMGLAGVFGVWVATRAVHHSLTRSFVLAPLTLCVAYLGLWLLPVWIPTTIVELIIWGGGFSAVVLIGQQAIIRVGARSQDTTSSIGVLLTQGGIAIGGALGAVIVSLFGVYWLPLTGIVVALLGVAQILAVRKHPLLVAR